MPRAFVVWITGLSGSGKTTLAKELISKVKLINPCVVIIDGDDVRQGLSQDLGFTLKDRSENVRRVAELAKLLNKQGVIVIVSMISPLMEFRENARNIIGQEGFKEIYLSTPLKICIARDPKDLYKENSMKHLNITGIDSPYEPPVNPLIQIDTTHLTIIQSVDLIFQSIKNDI